MINSIATLRQMHDMLVSYQEDLWKADEQMLEEYDRMVALCNRYWDETKRRYGLTDEQLHEAIDMEDGCE